MLRKFAICAMLNTKTTAIFVCIFSSQNSYLIPSDFIGLWGCEVPKAKHVNICPSTNKYKILTLTFSKGNFYHVRFLTKHHNSNIYYFFLFFLFFLKLFKLVWKKSIIDNNIVWESSLKNRKLQIKITFWVSSWKKS